MYGSRLSALVESERARGEGLLVISLDFELFWGMRDVVGLEAYRANLEGVHEVVPRILDTFARHLIHATWACVGLLFAHDRDEARSFAPELRPTYNDPRLSPFADLYDAAVDRNARCYFAPKLLHEIQARPGQEIGTHTFSHFYCIEAGQSAEQFDADLEAAIAVSQRQLGFAPKSLVFPRNQCNFDYLPVLRRRGIRAYRGLRRHWAYNPSPSKLATTVRRAVRLTDNYARVCPDGTISRRVLTGEPLDIPGSRFLRPYSPLLRHLDPLRLRRMQREMTHAAQQGAVYHLWWHPHNFGRHPRENLDMLDQLLGHAGRLRDRLGFRSLTMGEVSEVHATAH